MPSIPSVCQELGIKANRTHENGSPYHTLPAINDQANRKVVGDSFEIALHLDSAYPNDAPLFLPGTHGLTAALNAQVDALFTHYVCLCTAMPFPPEQLQSIMSIFMSRTSTNSTAAKPPSTPEEKEKVLQAFEKALGNFSKAYAHTGGTTDHILHGKSTKEEQAQSSSRGEVGPFLDGDKPVYADFVVGAWLAMFAECMHEGDWKRVREWHGGLWGAVHDALEPWRVIR